MRITNNLNRELLYMFNHNIRIAQIIFWREFNTLYRRTFLGPLWAFFAPLAFLCVFIFFRLLFGLSNPENIPMIPFLFSGLAMWLLFSQSVLSIFPSITMNVGILKKMPVSPLVFVFSAVALPLVTNLVYMLLLEGILIYYGYFPSVHHLFIPILIIMVSAFAIGIGLLVSTIAFYYQDIIQVLPTMIQLGMFATPIFFSASIVPHKLQWVVTINPIANCVNIFRQIIFFAEWPSLSIFFWGILLPILLLWIIVLPIFLDKSRYISDLF